MFAVLHFYDSGDEVQPLCDLRTPGSYASSSSFVRSVFFNKLELLVSSLAFNEAFLYYADTSCGDYAVPMAPAHYSDTDSDLERTEDYVFLRVRCS